MIKFSHKLASAQKSVKRWDSVKKKQDSSKLNFRQKIRTVPLKVGELESS